MQPTTSEHEFHFILECLDALTEARQRSDATGPAFGLAALIHACQTQGADQLHFFHHKVKQCPEGFHGRASL